MNEHDDQQRPGRTVPDPHAAEAPPPPQEGMRPEADAALVRPTEDEPMGPVPGLFSTAGAEAAAHYTDSPEAEATAEAAGVEEEGIESGQIVGLIAATVVGIFALVLVVYFLFYSPKLETTREQASDVPAERYRELRDVRAGGQELLGAYATNDDATFRLPIDAAMQRVAQDYADRAGTPAPGPQDGPPAGQTEGRPGAGMQGHAGVTAEPRYFGMSWLTLSPPAAIRAVGPTPGPASGPPAGETTGLPAAAASTPGAEPGAEQADLPGAPTPAAPEDH